MASTTGIEIGPDSYLLGGIRASREGAAEILTARRFAAGEWPADRRAFGDALATIRKSHHFPRRAAVVLWNTPDGGDGASEHDPLATLTAAGFEIVSVMTPPAALAKVAATTPRGAPADAIAWLALNTCGASISIVREADLLYSRTFSWSYNPDLPNSKSQLLQRYLLISHLAPELNHALRVVHAAHGANVALAVTCGNLPELRSLTLPLIEELDIEVETLDSTDGFASTRAGGFDVTELAPALRLVTAAALAAGPSQNAWTTSRIPRVAAAAAVITALAWAGYSFFHTATPTAARQASAPQPPPSPAVSPSQSAMNPPPQPVATRGSDEPKRAVSQTAQPSRPSSTQQSQPTPSDTRKAVTPQTSSTAALLTEPLPRIDTVLIDQDRRLAILDGAVVGVGDPVGSRVVVAIAREAILLREPSGRIVRVRPRVGM